MFDKLIDFFKTFSNDDFLELLLSPTFYESKVSSIFENNEIDINWQNETGEGYLHLCAQNNLTESIAWLIKNGADIELENKEEETALFYAAKHNHYDAVEELIKYKANVNHQNIHLRTPLQEAVIENQEKVIDILIKHTKNINNTDSHGHNVIFDAVSNGDMHLIEKVAHRKDLNINQIDNDGNTILHQKSALHDDDLALELMESGADPTLVDKHGKNFLFYAATKGIESEELIDKAISMGCNIKSRSNDNSTVLMETLLAFAKLTPTEIKRRESLLKMVKKLIHEGIDVNANNNYGETALFIAVREKDIEAISFLLEEGININHQNIEGETAFSMCVMNGIDYLDEMLILMKYGADVNLKNRDNKTVIEKLIDAVLYLYSDKKINDRNFEAKIDENGQYLVILKEILENSKVDLTQLNSEGKPYFFEPLMFKNDVLFKLLRDHGIDLNQKDSNENNILNNIMENAVKKYGFSEKRYFTVLKSLIALGADVNSTDKSGGTSAHKAVNDSCEQTLKLLLESKANVKAVDNKGRSLVHSCVWKGKNKHFSVLHKFDKDILNIPDNFGVLPINYAAFMGNQELVLSLIDAGAYINNPNKKDEKMLEFLYQFYDTLDSLSEGVKSELNKKNIKMLVINMKKEFKI